MPRVTPVHWRVLDCIFRKAGFVYFGKKGSHRKYKKDGIKRPVIIPEYTEIAVDLIESNRRTADMTKKQYFEYLELCK